jgi:hypothetical protein
MNGPKIEIVASVDVRKTLNRAGDVRGDVAFQNDVNALLARFEQMAVPWRALTDERPSEPARPIITDATPGPQPLAKQVARTRTLDGIGLAPLVVKNPPRVRRAGR